MPNFNRKRAGAKLPIILLSTLIFLLLLASPTVAANLGNVTEDPEGTVNVQDVVLVMQHILGIADPELTESQLLAADVNGGGAVNVQDATLIMQYVLGLIDEFPAPDPFALEVVSVRAINRTTIEVELEEGVDEVLAEDEEQYQVTVDGDAVVVEEVAYDAADDLAVLTVDLEGLYGVLVVNGVEAEDEVPAIPEYISIHAIEGSRDFTLKFNTPVYEKSSLNLATDFEVSVAGQTSSIDEIDITDVPGDAVDEFTITVEEAGRPEAFDSVVVTIKSSGAAKIANVWGEPMEDPAIRSTTTQEDNDPPNFTGITVYNNSNFVTAHFSEPVNTSGDPISVGPNADQVAVTGVKSDGTPLVAFTGTGIAAVNRDDELSSLKIQLDSAVPAGATISVSFGVDAGQKIEDRAENELAGTYTRSGTAVAGPNLTNASVTDLGSKAEGQTQVFETTLVGDLYQTEEITIDLTQGNTGDITYSSVNTDYSVSGASGSVSSNGSIITFDPSQDISDGTTIIITAKDVNTETAAAVEEDLAVVFERSDAGTTTTATFDILAGLSGQAVTAEYTHTEGTVQILASGEDDHLVTFEFALEGKLDDGEAVEIDVSNLINGGVTFDSTKIDPKSGSVKTELVGSKIIITADGDIASGTIAVEADGVDVATGSSADDVEVIFTRLDSGLAFAEEIDIEASFSAVGVSNIAKADNQTLFITFTLDGSRASSGYMARVDLDAGGPLIFTGAEVEQVSDGTASISTTSGIVYYFAPSGGLAHGTEVTIQVSGVDASGAADATSLFRRVDTEYEAVTTLVVE